MKRKVLNRAQTIYHKYLKKQRNKPPKYQRPQSFKFTQQPDKKLDKPIKMEIIIQPFIDTNEPDMAGHLIITTTNGRLESIIQNFDTWNEQVYHFSDSQSEWSKALKSIK